MSYNKETYQLIQKLTQLQGTSGHEKQVRDFMKEEMMPLVDDVEITGLGNLFGVRRAKEDAPTFMIAAHLDEVGFMVKEIQTNGLLSVVPLGGWNPYVVSGQRFTLQTTKGDYPCISSAVSPHLLRNQSVKQTAKVEDVLFDAGFMSKEEAIRYGVRPGDTLVPQTETVLTANQKNVISKAWDNRYGCTLVLETLKETKGQKLNVNLVAGATVQEEVGARGANGALYHYDPDIFIALDCSAADDVHNPAHAMGRLGEGCLIRMHDPSLLVNKGLREYMLDIASTYGIPHQAFFSQGGTDASAGITTRSGIISGVVGVPSRYIHGHQGLFNLSDYEAAKELVKQLILNFDQSTLETIRQV